MSNPGDEPAQESPARATSGNPQPAERYSGRIAYDERGNSVWEWQLETGVYSRDISTQRLKKLDLTDLSIADTARYLRPPGLTGGSNPNGNSSTAGGNVGTEPYNTDPYNSAGRGALKSDASRGQPGRKPVDPKKLQEWMDLRRRVERNKREEGED